MPCPCRYFGGRGVALMVLKTRASVAFLAAILSATSASAREPLTLAPSSQWVLDYADDKCRLMRKFGSGENLVELQIEQSSRAPYYNLGLFGQPVSRVWGDLIRVAFGPNEAPSERSFISGKMKDPKMPFLLMHGIHLAPVPDDARQGEFPVIDIGPERERAITRLTLERGLYKPLELEIGSMGEPLEAMRVCVDDLIKELQLDPEGMTEIVTEPKPRNLYRIARQIQQIYPSRMEKNRTGGTVEVRLVINKEGKPTTCQIAKSDRPAAFDDYVCFGLMRNAEFEPAIGPDGEPRYGVWSTTVIYDVS